MSRSILVNSFVVSEDMDDDVAYALIKSIAENQDAITGQIAMWKAWTPEEGCNEDSTIVPIHPGAARYYQEVGAM